MRHHSVSKTGGGRGLRRIVMDPPDEAIKDSSLADNEGDGSDEDVVRWSGGLGEDWLGLVVVGTQKMEAYALDGEGQSWAGQGSEEEIRTRARVDGGLNAKLRAVLEESAAGKLRIAKDGSGSGAAPSTSVVLEVPFGHGTISVAKLAMERRSGFGEQVLAELKIQRDRRLVLERDLKKTHGRCKELVAALELCTKEKMKLEENMLTKFCVVLNEKKRKIADLQARLDEQKPFTGKKNVQRNLSFNSSEDRALGLDGSQSKGEDAEQSPPASSQDPGTVPLEDLL